MINSKELCAYDGCNNLSKLNGLGHDWYCDEHYIKAKLEYNQI